MKRYYFDIRNGYKLVRDEKGVDLETIDSVQEETARALAELANAPVEATHRIAVEVRDADGPILRVRFAFDLDGRAKQKETGQKSRPRQRRAVEASPKIPANST